jgi:arylsulfatase A-like enzyme
MAAAGDKPNVLIIIMDDLAYGDLVCHGNPHTQTPHLDRLHSESTRLTRYCSGPLCTPARAALMTGRHPYRTRAIDTYCGRAMLDPDEVTLAELMRDAGYATAISGKWHLGDCYPMRAMDKGFDEALVHNSGGIGQPGNQGNGDYFDPGLMHNGRPTPSQGYCTDIFADHCIDFVQSHTAEPWFCYLATNAPHCPMIVGDEWAQRYLDKGMPEKLARFYGMVDNIDMNVGRVLKAIDQTGQAGNTIVVYTSDHGPCPSAMTDGRHRFNAGLRDGKGTLYEGGVRTPCFWRWPGRIAAGQDVDRVTNPIDFMPTLAAACGLTLPTDRTIDGANLLPLMTGETTESDWADRTVCMQWHRGDIPEKYRNGAAIGQRYKWLSPSGWKPTDPVRAEELYDLEADPGEQQNIIDQQPDIAAALKAEYERWFEDVSSTRGSTPEENYMCPATVVGTAHENPTLLSRQDGRLYKDASEGWGTRNPMWWWVTVPEAAAFDVRVRLPKELDGAAKLTIRWQDVEQTVDVDQYTGEHRFENVVLAAGTGRFEATLMQDQTRLCVREAWLTRRDIPVNSA